MKHVLTTCLSLMLAGCSGQPATGSGDASVGGSSAGGGSNVAGATHSGGQLGLGGASQCLCPGYACQAGISFTVHAQGAGTTGGIITALTATVNPNEAVQCYRNGCQFTCRTTSYSLPDGSYAFTFASPGYAPTTANIDVVNPTNCGCCGCCPFAATKDIVLQPTGATVVGCCTDSLQTDASNCGSCGHVCPSGIDCVAGQCEPSIVGCIYRNSGSANCNAYCASLGRTCTAGCSSLGIAFQYQTTSCPGGSTVTGYSSTGPCSQAFTWDTSGTDSYSCCCTNG